MIIKSKVIGSGSLIKDEELIYCTIEAGSSFVNCNFYGCRVIGLSDFDSCNFHNCIFTDDAVKATNCIFDGENDFGEDKSMVEYFVSGKGVKEVEHLLNIAVIANSYDDYLEYIKVCDLSSSIKFQYCNSIDYNAKPQCLVGLELNGIAILPNVKDISQEVSLLLKARFRNLKLFNDAFTEKEYTSEDKSMVEYFVSGKGATADKNLYHLIRHCKKCNGTKLKLISKGDGQLGSFGDFYKCNDCGLVNDDFIFTKKEYTKDEYAAEALKLLLHIDALLVKLNFYNSKNE